MSPSNELTSTAPSVRPLGVIFVAWALSLLGPGCGGGATSSTTDASTSGGAEAGGSPTAGTNGSATDDSTMTSGADAEEGTMDAASADDDTSAADDSSAGESASAGSTGPSSSESTGSTGELDPETYGPCWEPLACGIMGEICYSPREGTFSACIYACESFVDCPPPHTSVDGTAEIECLDFDGFPGLECGYDCAGGRTCPTGMECLDDNLCVWPAE